jgi:hypothetical protein
MTFSAAFSKQWFVENAETVDWEDITLKMTIMVRSPAIADEWGDGDPADIGYLTLPELDEIGWQAAPNDSSTGGTQSVVSSTDLVTGEVSISVPEDEGFEYEGPAVVMTSIVISIDAVDDADQFILLALEPTTPTYLYGTADYPVVLKNPADGQLFSYIAETNDGGAANSVKTYIGPDGLVGYGLNNGTYASTPDSAALDIVGDLEITARLQPTNWFGAYNQGIVGKRYFAPNYAYWFSMYGGNPSLQWSPDGTDVTTALCLTDVPFTTECGWIRVTLDVSDPDGGWTATFYTAPDSPTEPTSSWTQLGAVVTMGSTTATSIFSTTPVVEFGSNLLGGNQIQGVLKHVIIRNGIGGTIVCNANFDAQPKNTVTFTETSSNTAAVTVTTSRIYYDTTVTLGVGSPGISSAGIPWEDSLIAHVWVSPQRINYAVNPSFEESDTPAFGWRSNAVMTVETGGVTLSMGDRSRCVKLAEIVGDNIVLESLPIPNQRISSWWSLEAAVSGIGKVRIGMLFWPPAMEEGSATYVTTSWVDINTPDGSGFIPIKSLIPNVEDYRAAQFRLEFQGEGDIFVDNVLVDPNEAQLGYFDGDWEMGMSGDYSWYGDNNPTPHKSYSLYYNNRSSLNSYLFPPLGDGDNPPNHHVRSWVPEGASVNIHWDHLHAGTSPSWGDTVYMPILDFAVKDEVATVASTSITSTAYGSLIPDPEET